MSVMYERFSKKEIKADDPELKDVKVNKEKMLNFFFDHQTAMNTDATTKRDDLTSESEANVDEDEGSITNFLIPSTPQNHFNKRSTIQIASQTSEEDIARQISAPQ